MIKVGRAVVDFRMICKYRLVTFIIQPSTIMYLFDPERMNVM